MAKRLSTLIFIALACLFAIQPQAAGAKPAKGARSRASTSAVPLQFANLLAAGKYSQTTPLFDPLMQASVDPTKLEGVWRALLMSNGSFQHFLPPHEEKQGQYTICYVPAQFSKSTIDLKVVLTPQNKIGGFFVAAHTVHFSPAAYDNPSSYTEVPTKIPSGSVQLDALWTMPKGAGPFPALILVHGSGPQDKDETLGPNKPFKDLAGGLAAQGIAVLRYEKRTKQFPTSIDPDKVTVKEETIDDACAAVKLAKTTNKIDGKRVFVLGHSLGGMVLPRIAKSCSIAGGIILAGNSRPLEDLMLEQLQYLIKDEHFPNKDEAIADMKRRVAKVKSASLEATTPASQLPMGVPGSYWLDLRGYNPVATAKAVKIPWLIMQGQRDYQVTASGDFAKWQQGMSGNPNVTFKLYPNLSHLFAEGSGKATPQEYMAMSKHVSLPAITDIANWIKAH